MRFPKLARSRKRGWSQLDCVNGLWKAWILISILALQRDNPAQGAVLLPVSPELCSCPSAGTEVALPLPCLFPAKRGCYSSPCSFQTPLCLSSHWLPFLSLSVQIPSPRPLASQMPPWPQPFFTPSSELGSAAPASLCQPS